MSDDFETRVQRKAEAHLAACNEALFEEEGGEEEVSSPAFGPYDGCDTCVVREVLMSVWDDFQAEARREVGVQEPPAEDWIVPGGAVIDESRQVKLRLHPPPDWHRLILEVARTPPSMNNNEIRSHWTGFHEHKKGWQAEIALLFMANQLRRGGYQRAIAGAFLRFPDRSVRDSGNFAGLINKALGDALVIDPHMPRGKRYIPDDDGQHYYFGGVEFEPDTGPPRTTIYLYLQPKED